MVQSRKSGDDEAVKTAQSLRLLKAFLALESQPVREALLILAESLAAASEGRRP